MLPRFVSDYRISLLISIFAYVAMATAWSFFSGTTRYISLATSAFIGIGVYAVTLSIDRVPLALGLALAALAGFLVALVVGLSTLRLQGVYFVIFTFGLAELIKQLVTWYEVNRNKNLMRLVFADVSNVFLYEALLAIAVVTVAGSWLAGRTRLGFALRAIGEDETVARHTGVNTTLVKVASLRAHRLGHRADGRDPVAALLLHRSEHRLQLRLVLPGADHVAARGSGTRLGPAARRDSARAPLRVPGGHVSPSLRHRARPLLRGHRLLSPRRRGPLARAGGSGSGRADRGVTVAGAGILLRVSGLRKAFGGLVAVRDLTFDVPAGAIVGLIGPNGSGKTTVLNLITGEIAAR